MYRNSSMQQKCQLWRQQYEIWAKRSEFYYPFSIKSAGIQSEKKE